MPRRLLDRCAQDSIREFRVAADRRFHDGLVLAANGRRTAAIYLWGYAVEMLIKASYFSAIGLAETQALTLGLDIHPAINQAQASGIAWPNQGRGHNIRAWAEWLVLRRNMLGVPYALDFGLNIQRNGQRIWQLWRETLRYHKNFAYAYEMNQVRESAEWFVAHSQDL